MRRGKKLENRINHAHSSQTKAVNFARNVILTEQVNLEGTRIGGVIWSGRGGKCPSHSCWNNGSRSSAQNGWRGHVFTRTDNKAATDMLLTSKKPLAPTAPKMNHDATLEWNIMQPRQEWEAEVCKHRVPRFTQGACHVYQTSQQTLRSSLHKRGWWVCTLTSTQILLTHQSNCENASESKPVMKQYASCCVWLGFDSAACERNNTPHSQTHTQITVPGTR